MADQKAHFSVYTSCKQELHKETPPSLLRAVQVLACYPHGVAFCTGGGICLHKQDHGVSSRQIFIEHKAKNCIHFGFYGLFPAI